jgi:hypothetical protein
MNKYYDEIYPAVFKKLAKQYGGKVGETKIPVGQQQYVVMAEGNENPISVHLSKEKAEYEINQQIERDKLFDRPVGNYSVVSRNSENRKVRYYEPSDEAKVKIKGGIAMKDGGAVRMSEGGKPLTPYEQFKIQHEEMIRRGKEEIANRNKYDPYKGSGKPVPTTRPSGAAGVVPSVEPSGSGSPSLLNPLNRKNGGDVNLDAMRYALTKGK